jgi:hypothetical protein
LQVVKDAQVVPGITQHVAPIQKAGLTNSSLVPKKRGVISFS